MLPWERKTRVLLVDDSADMRGNVRRLLSFTPTIVIVGEAANGEEAVLHCRGLQPDVVLMDLSMPRMDGVQAAQAILQEYPNTCVVIMSAYGEQYNIDRSLAAGAQAFLIKPFSIEVLVETIQRLHRPGS